MEQLECEEKLRSKVQLLQFLTFMNFNSNKNNSFESVEFINYKSKIKKISRKIDRWHTKVALQKEKTFQNDEDFSPTQFASPEHFCDDSDTDGEDLCRA